MNWKEEAQGHPIFDFNLREPDAQCNNCLSLVATYNTEVFVACDNVIRYADITKREDYTVLDIPTIDFEIQGLLLNKTRSMLVIIGARKLLAAFIPRGVDLRTRTLRSQPVGGTLREDTTIRQVLLHPYCSTESTIVVLTSDSFLRLYDLNLSFSEPEQTIDIVSQEQRDLSKKHFLGDLDDMDCASFCFGAGGDGWTLFTIFVLSTSGDVFTVSPVLPSNCQLSLTEIEAFHCIASTEATGRSLTTAYMRLSQAIDRGTRTMNGVAFVRPTRLPTPIVQGPALLTPAPLELTKLAVISTDICFLPSQPMNVIVLASTGKLDICLLSEPLIPRADISTTMSVYETIVLNNLERARFYIADKKDYTSVFFSHANGVYELSMAFWLKDLAEVFESGDQQKIRETASDGISSQLTTILDSEGSTIIGCGVVERDFERTLLALRKTYDVHILQITSDSLLKELDALNVADGTEDAPIQESSNVSAPQYQSLLSKPVYRAPQLPAGPKIVIPSSLANKRLQADEGTIKFLAKYALQMRRDMENLMNALVSMHRRLDLQQKEFERQRAKLNSLLDNVRKLSVADADRLEGVKLKQKDLDKRCAKLIQDLMNNHSPKLSEAERRWCEELKRIEKHVRGQKGLIAHLNTAKEQFEAIKQLQLEGKLDAKPETETSDGALRTTQISKMKMQIESSEALLQKTKARLERLMRVDRTAALSA